MAGYAAAMDFASEAYADMRPAGAPRLKGPFGARSTAMSRRFDSIANRPMATVSKLDAAYLELLRAHITEFLKRAAKKFGDNPGRLLEIGVQDHFGARNCFQSWTIDSFDIVSTFSPTYVGDITKHNPEIEDGSYDMVVCMDVLEHTVDPFGALREIYRMLTKDGVLLMSSPLNFRMHGPVPDCWRFTEHGLRVLLREFDLVELDVLQTPDRDLFPIHYNVLARKLAKDAAAE